VLAEEAGAEGIRGWVGGHIVSQPCVEGREPQQLPLNGLTALFKLDGHSGQLNTSQWVLHLQLPICMALDKMGGGWV